MEKSIIEIKNVGKKYNITHQKGGYIALRDVLMNIIKSPFSFLKTKIKRATGFEKQEEFWALKDVNFTVKKGEVVGIIGANGAGKSTLLKILSQITPPTEGEIILRGRVGSLLEVGTGFHPELTGRENIFLNGAILGMKKKEIAKKFDEIVEFAGIGKFLDTPVKYYSSGMYVRLAFSVAAHMEPDILIVDEVLAVGDAEFQKKCLGKMDEITKKEGRTILFVSHNLGAIKQLCSKCVLLEKGQVKNFGETEEVIEKYISSKINSEKILYAYPENENKQAQILSVEIKNEKNEKVSSFDLKEKININLEYKIYKKCPKTIISLEFFSSDGIMFYLTTDSDTGKHIPEKQTGKYKTTLSIPEMFLNPGNYFLYFTIQSPGVEMYDRIENIPINIKKDDEDIREKYFNGKFYGYISTVINWNTKNI
jgi:lipopolysaccharide transport system ATP-binding protein